MKKVLLIFMAAAIAASLLSGCVTIAFRSAGSVGVINENSNEYSYPCGDFTKFYSNLAANLYYSAKKSDSITIMMPEEIAEHVSVENKGGRLSVITDLKRQADSFSDLPTIYLYAPTLDEMEFEGYVFLRESDEINADKFTITAAGAINGDISVKADQLVIMANGASGLCIEGAADSVVITANGASYVNARGLDARIANVEINGAGNVDISCSETLNARLAGAGGVKYWGDPVVNKSSAGIGGVKKAG